MCCKGTRSPVEQGLRMGCAFPAAEREGPASMSPQPTPSSRLGISQRPDVNPSSGVSSPERTLYPPLMDHWQICPHGCPHCCWLLLLALISNADAAGRADSLFDKPSNCLRVCVTSPPSPSTHVKQCDDGSGDEASGIWQGLLFSLLGEEACLFLRWHRP